MVLLSLLFLAALAQPCSASEKPIQWGEPVNNQSISISSDKECYEAGERMVVRVRIKNMGNESATLTYRVPLEYNIQVYLVESADSKMVDKRGGSIVPSDGRVRYTLYGCLQFERLVSSTGAAGALRPGEVRCLEVDLNRIFDMSIAGTYRIAARRLVWRNREVETGAEAVSNTLDVTVRDRPLFRRTRQEN